MKNQIDENFSVLNKTIAVAYLVRGADIDWLLSCKRFLDSYTGNQAGCEHSLYVIFKGFGSDSDLEKARILFRDVAHKCIFLADDSFDLGAYIEWANMIEEELICALNTNSEIMTPNWLYKLAVNLLMPNVGLVGATGSYESLRILNSAFPEFPNIHIRTNAFMINRAFFCSITAGVRIVDKMDAHFLESGSKSFTKQVLNEGKEILVVGRSGRGYSPQFWPMSGTFRQGNQENLLVSDNQTRSFAHLPWAEKKRVLFYTWGRYIKK